MQSELVNLDSSKSNQILSNEVEIPPGVIFAFKTIENGGQECIQFYYRRHDKNKMFWRISVRSISRFFNTINKADSFNDLPKYDSIEKMAEHVLGTVNIAILLTFKFAIKIKYPLSDDEYCSMFNVSFSNIDTQTIVNSLGNFNLLEFTQSICSLSEDGILYFDEAKFNNLTIYDILWLCCHCNSLI